MVVFILHTHMPYVLHHGAWPHGSDWLCEATAESYLPLLRMCDRLLDEGIRPGITLDISPVLCEQLSHPDFPVLFEEYCRHRMELAHGDRPVLEAEGAEPERLGLTDYWYHWYEDRLTDFTTYGRDIVGALRRLQDTGAIEIMTCGVTHGYLPLLAEDASVDLQIRLATDNYERHFGRRARGIWLPECAYRPAYPWRTLLPVAPYATTRMRDSVEQVMTRHDLGFFVTDADPLSRARPLGIRGPDGHRTHYDETYGTVREQLDERSTYDLFRVGAADHDDAPSVVAFARNVQIALQVWSGKSGYPGDPDYLDFHKKFHRSSLRYWRVTDVKADMAFKQAYIPEWAASKVRDHAAHFVNVLEVAIGHRRSTVDREPLVCLPFDTELFGHWWFEGIDFLEHVLRGIHGSASLGTSTASEAMDGIGPSCEVALPESSWGQGGGHDVWMNPDTQWTWEREYAIEHRMRMLSEKHPMTTWDATMRRIMMNALREMLLAQASDWQFLITNFSARDYATMRFHNHADEAMRFCDMAERYMVSSKLQTADVEMLRATEERDGILEPELLRLLRSEP